jgi:hypothetical protein
MCKRSAIHASVIVVSPRSRAAILTFQGSPLRRAPSCSAVQPKLWMKTVVHQAAGVELPVGLLESLTQSIQEHLCVRQPLSLNPQEPASRLKA